jgi:thymidylate synthase (FAD)
MENNNPWEIYGSSKARLVSHTPDPEAMLGYIARVTSKDQSNPKVEGLLKYCAKHGHWSVFEQASMTLEVVTPLAIAVQLLRHRSFTFQQFSGRYEDQQEMAKHTEGLSAQFNMFYVPEEARIQDVKNRQNSIPAGMGDLTDAMWNTMATAYTVALSSYNDLLQRGVAKEVARFVLPQGVYSRLYVTGSCRSWIHFLGVRDDEGVAQWEHVELARACKSIFAGVFPTVYRSLDWGYNKSENETERLKNEVVELRSEIQTLKAMKHDSQGTPVAHKT